MSETRQITEALLLEFEPLKALRRNLKVRFSQWSSVAPKAGSHDLLPNPHPARNGFWR
jgi:hypothetical protein